jgi:hypothetical protein
MRSFVTSFESLFSEHGAAITLHGSIVRGDELCRQHAFDLVLGRDANEGC